METKVLLKLLSLPNGYDIHFQPIFSATKQRLIGYEALLRAYDKHGHRMDPLKIFADAKNLGISVDFDRAVREKAIESFAALGATPNNILFLNFESSIIDEGVTGSGRLMAAVKAHGLVPSQVAIELKESSVINSMDLVRFCNIQKANGFLIALDDVGAKFSNLSRFVQLKPDIIKLDKSLVRDIHTNHFASIMIRSITEMFHSTGALVVAEGIETLEEALEAMVLGVDFLQGFYLAYPDVKLKNSDEIVKETMSDLAVRKKSYYRKLQQERHSAFVRLENNTEDFIAKLCAKDATFIDIATHFLKEFTYLDSIYILNEAGSLIDETVTRNPKVNLLFSPGFKNEDFSLSDYYYMVLDSENGKFLTNKYISKANGKLCQTFSRKFSLDGKDYILCLDEMLS
jgi:EAL domain-containing protein (putative c-di-GMP-specific phosphodiesterase class I)